MNGAVGNGTTADSLVPAKLVDSGVQAIAAGYSISFAALSNGAVYAWGGASPALGSGNASSDRTTPVPLLAAAEQPFNLLGSGGGTTTATLTGIGLSSSSLTVGSNTAITPLPASAGLGSCTSSNTAVATVTGNSVTALAVGSATITCSGFSTSLTVTDSSTSANTLTGITLSSSSLTIGHTTTVSPTPTSAALGACTSSNTAIATVSGNKVTAVGAGSATITCLSFSASLTVTAISSNQRLTGIGVSTTELAVGSTATIRPIPATAELSQCSSSNLQVAEISGFTIVGKAEGIAAITCRGSASEEERTIVMGIVTAPRSGPPLARVDASECRPNSTPAIPKKYLPATTSHITAGFITPADDIGKVANIYLGLMIGGNLQLHNGTGFVPYADGPIPVYRNNETLKSRLRVGLGEYIPISTGINAQLLAGYQVAGGEIKFCGYEFVAYGARMGSVQLDNNHAVSRRIQISGGTISATGSDGTVFTLTIPAQALSQATTITMTPIVQASGIPYSDGMTAGVDLQPDYLILDKPATLTIQLPSGKSANDLGAFSYSRLDDRDNKEFFIHPQDMNTGPSTLSILHFSGYGLGAGEEEGNWPDDTIENAMAKIAKSIRSAKSASIAGGNRATQDMDTLLKEVTEALTTMYPSIRQGLGNCVTSDLSPRDAVRTAVEPWLKWWKQISLFALNSDPPFSGLIEESRVEVEKCLDAAFNKAANECRARGPDHGSVQDMLGILHDRAILGFDEQFEQLDAALIDCVRFELDIDSTIVAEMQTESMSRRRYGSIKVNKLGERSMAIRIYPLPKAPATRNI